MENNTSKVITTYKEVKIGKTTYRVTSVFLGEKDLKTSLENLAIRKAMIDIHLGRESKV